MKEVVVINWEDASCHGNEPYSDKEAKDVELAQAVSCGIKVYEDKNKITIATDYFTDWDSWRTLSSYPKSGIKKIERLKVKED